MDISTISDLSFGEIIELMNMGVALPAIWLGLFTTILLLVDLFIERKIVTAWLTLGGLGVSFVLNLFHLQQ